jgi:hypothetical protein
MAFTSFLQRRAHRPDHPADPPRLFFEHFVEVLVRQSLDMTLLTPPFVTLHQNILFDLVVTAGDERFNFLRNVPNKPSFADARPII